MISEHFFIQFSFRLISLDKRRNTGCPEIHLSERKLNTRAFFNQIEQFFILNERAMFKVFYWFQINNMTHSLEAKIQVVSLMTKYESHVTVIRELQLFGFAESCTNIIAEREQQLILTPPSKLL